MLHVALLLLEMVATEKDGDNKGEKKVEEKDTKEGKRRGVLKTELDLFFFSELVWVVLV